MQAALRVEVFHRVAHIAARKLLYYLLKRRVFLPHNFVKPRRMNSSFLQLLIGCSCFDGLMLSHIAYKQHAVAFSEAMQELIHLLRTGQTRFVQNVESLNSIMHFIASRKMALKCAGFDSSLRKFLRRA